jgi:hypothetical protein
MPVNRCYTVILHKAFEMAGWTGHKTWLACTEQLQEQVSVLAAQWLAGLLLKSTAVPLSHLEYSCQAFAWILTLVAVNDEVSRASCTHHNIKQACQHSPKQGW